MKRYRNEWKYCIPSAMALELREKLSAIMVHDPNASDSGYYKVHSLYFDNISNTCARENIAGERLRFKYRIRFYNEYTGKLYLERKEKFNSLCHKQSCIIFENEYNALKRGDFSSLIFENERSLLARFATDIASDYFTPKSIVEYEREALIEPITNVRITFDRNILVSSDTDKFLSADYTGIPVIDGEKIILEVKFDGILPGHITRILKAGHLTQQAYSKYYNSRVLTVDYKGVI